MGRLVGAKVSDATRRLTDRAEHVRNLKKWSIPVIRNLLWAEGALFCLAPPQVAYQLLHRPGFDPSSSPLQVAIFVGLTYLFITGIAGLMAAYGMEQNRPWAVKALQGASIFNLLLVPFGTILGGFGFWLTYDPAARAMLVYEMATDEPKPSTATKSRVRLGRFVVGIQILASLILIPLVANYLKALGTPMLDYVSFVACFLLAVLVGILCHELGHVLAGKMSGLRFQTLAAGPLVVSKMSDGWRFQWVNSRGLWNGITVMSPTGPTKLRSNAVFFVLGGPIGSLLCGSGALALMLAGPGLHLGEATEFFGMLAVIELLNGVSNLVPLQVPGGFTDGARLLQLFRKDAEGKRFLAELAFGLSDTTTLRPKDWHPQWIRAVTEDPLAPGFSRGCYHAYVHYLDSGNIDEASIWLARCMDSHRALKRDPYRWILAIENAFFEARHLKNVEAAKEWLDVPRAGIPAERFTELRVRAAIHIAEGERDLARPALEAAVRLHAECVESGRQQFERAVLRDVQNWLDELTGAGSLSRLAQAVRERDSLIEAVKALDAKPSPVQRIQAFLRPQP